MRRILYALVCFLLALSLLAGCSGGKPGMALPAGSQDAASLPASLQPSGGASAPGGGWALDIDTVALDGTPVTSADFAGNTLTVLNVWATWCPPCVGELPHLQAMSELFAGAGVQIVGVLQDGVTQNGKPDQAVIADAETLLSDAGADYLVILPDAALETEFISQMQYFPTTFFLDSSGEVVETVIGANDAAGWEETINGVLEKVA